MHTGLKRRHKLPGKRATRHFAYVQVGRAGIKSQSNYPAGAVGDFHSGRATTGKGRKGSPGASNKARRPAGQRVDVYALPVDLSSAASCSTEGDTCPGGEDRLPVFVVGRAILPEDQSPTTSDPVFDFLICATT